MAQLIVVQGLDVRIIHYVCCGTASYSSSTSSTSFYFHFSQEFAFSCHSTGKAQFLPLPISYTIVQIIMNI